ncbi:MaoC/PaaZ C-terminal domain-containing protein [Antarcticimicrobium luteum]|uniref:MaoC/PaaZ C-terminal domain-containing protein n=1 Tax=Antarcticimicrobium luteum TaxID=2547397 RepID=UPI00140D5C27|nr:MaoC/PaaZ C-terminal domain-containing protein [Antarcticimicrobium luteum]
MSIDLSDRQSLQHHIGQQIGVSSWHPISQADIDTFGRLTRDEDAMHMDPAWARQHSPFGVTIVYGFQTLSMLTAMINEILDRGSQEAYKLNYGFDRVRLMAPVAVDTPIRGVAKLSKIEDRGPDRFLVTIGMTVEIQGQEKPAVVADWLFMVVNGAEQERRPQMAGSST